MVSPKQLLWVIESTLLGRTPPTASQRIELILSIRHSLPSIEALLSYPPPKPSDRAQVQLKEVRLPDAGPISLDDQDVQIALKLSDDLHLNELDCVGLLVSANQEWGLLGREPVEIFRLAAGLWYTARRDLLTAFYMLLRAVVLDQGLEADLVADIYSYLHDLFTSGLRQRLTSLIKELGREESTGFGGPNSESYILDSRGALVERKAVVSRERLIIGHCLVLSILVERASPKDVKDIFLVLKESASEYWVATDFLNHQITYCLLFALVIAFISDALSTAPEKVPVLSHDASFRREFNEMVMVLGNDPVVEGFVDCVRLAWVVHLFLVQDGHDSKEMTATLSNDMKNICSCLEIIFANNVFQFWLDKILHSAAYQNDDEDMIYMYNAYLHKLMTCFLSHPLARDKRKLIGEYLFSVGENSDYVGDLLSGIRTPVFFRTSERNIKVKETKENAMAILSPYRTATTHNQMIEGSGSPQGINVVGQQPFVSLLEFVSEIYQKEPELLSSNDVIWTFVKFSGEEHTNFQTLVAFLKMLSTLACNMEGAFRVFELLQGNTFYSIGWSTLFDCLSIYEEKFKQSVQNLGAVLPEFQEGDAKALVAYLNVLKQVVENGSRIERKNWFPDIEPLFKLLSYENVPPYLKGAMRSAIAAFVHVSPVMKDKIWRYLEQYDLPVVFGPNDENSGHAMDTQVYDMKFELNEVEARREQYPSTISFINLLNTLIAEERDVNDRGHRFVGIFRFIYDHVFGPFSQRAYADPCEKWQLVVACLKHFHMMLSMYDLGEAAFDAVTEQSQFSMMGQSSQIDMQVPVVEIMKGSLGAADFMSGKILFHNIMSIVVPGVNFLITERTNQIYGQLLEKAVLLSLETIILVMEKDFIVSEFWRPLYQLSRIIALPQLLLKSNYANGLIEDYAACLDLRSEDCQIYEDSSVDPGVLIMQLLIDNIDKPAPSMTHLLLKFDVNSPVERTYLQPKFHYSCLKVILEILDKLLKPDVNALLHEFGFQLLYELCVDPLTSAPTMDLLCTKKYQFFVKHLNSVGVSPLPNRNCSQALRISSLHQRAWLLKLLAVELHSADMIDTNHREACQSILSELFGQRLAECDDNDASGFTPENDKQIATTGSVSRSKVLELLEVIQFDSPDITLKSSEFVSSLKYSSLAEDILNNPATSRRDVYYQSERGDRLIDLSSFRDRLWQKCGLYNSQPSSLGSEAELNEIREATQELLKWGWKYNKNLEEQSAQLHMLTSWSQIVEVSASQRISFFENRSDILFQLLDASLNFSGSPDCSLKMAQVLTQVCLTCMAKLRDERFVFPSGLTSDMVTCLDIIMTKQLPNGACHSILFKLVMAILRHESSEALRRRQYALLLSYFQYCRHMLDSDVQMAFLQFLSVDEQDNGDLDLEKIDKDQAELAHANFEILRKEHRPVLNLVIKDAIQGSESVKIMSFYVLDALICVDHENFFMSKLQSRSFLRTCFTDISNFSYQGGGFSLDSMQRLCTLEAELSLLLRISHKYGKSGSQLLFSTGFVQHIALSRALHFSMKENIRHIDSGIQKKSVDYKQRVVAPALRLLFSLTALVDGSEFFEVKNKVVREIIEFVRGHQWLFDQILREDLSDGDEYTMELISLVVGILSKVWPYEESDEYGFVQGLFGMMHALFSRGPAIFTSVRSEVIKVSSRIQQKAGVSISCICFSLSSYLYFLVTKKSLRLHVSDGSAGYHESTALQQPTLVLLVIFLGSVATGLERATEEKYLLLNKIKDINELSRQEVDEIINLYVSQDFAPSSENMQHRRCTAMASMCRIVGHWSRLIILLLLLAQNLMNIILAHFQDSAYGSSFDAKGDLPSLFGELIPVLERLEIVSERIKQVTASKFFEG
ncbi:hypothetical protein OROGR_006316 [Orobanche gracilis]